MSSFFSLVESQAAFHNTMLLMRDFLSIMSSIYCSVTYLHHFCTYLQNSPYLLTNFFCLPKGGLHSASKGSCKGEN